MKIKPWLKTTLIVIIPILATILFDIISPIQVFSWIGRQIKLLFTPSLPFKLWLIFLTFFLFRINKKIRLISNTKSPKEPILKKPDYVKEYTEQVFGPVLYKWNWIKTSNVKFPYNPDQIEFFCPNCNCELVIQKIGEYQCPLCEITYGVKDMNTVKALIRHKVENNKWKDSPKKKIPRA